MSYCLLSVLVWQLESRLVGVLAVHLKRMVSILRLTNDFCILSGITKEQEAEMKPIDKPSVTVVKNFPMPPEGVKNVVKATVILLGMSPEEAKVSSLLLLLLLLLSLYGDGR